MAFDSSGAKAISAAPLGTTPKRCELQLFFAGFRQAIWRWKALDLRRLNMQFQQDWPKIKELQLFQFLAENLQNFARLTIWCASRGIDNFSLSQLFGQYGNVKLSIT